MAVTARTDCLVALQERRVDAILLPNSILAGLQAQDPTTRMLSPLPQPEAQNSYGIAVSQNHPDLVRFVNALLERWRTDGTLAALQADSLPPGLRTDPVAPAAEVRRLMALVRPRRDAGTPRRLHRAHRHEPPRHGA